MAHAKAEQCVAGNLLEQAVIGESFGVLREQRLFDGKLPDEHAPLNDYVAAVFLQPGSSVLFDLQGSFSLATVQLYSDNKSDNVFSYSLDGKHFSVLPLSLKQDIGALSLRTAAAPHLSARYLRIQRDDKNSGGIVDELHIS